MHLVDIQPADPSPLSRVPTGVVGRAAEADRLLAAARRAAQGGGGAVVVCGEPGMGKTTVLGLFADQCRDLGVRVCAGRADEIERRLPFAALGSCVGAWSVQRDPDVEAVAALLRGDTTVPLGSGATSDRDFLATEAFVDLIRAWCARGPVALLLDDVQWADEPSLLALHRLGQMLRTDPLTVLLTVRPRSYPGAVGGLLRSLTARGAHTLPLGPLTDDAVAELVQRHLGAPPGTALRDLLAAAGGNPTHLVEWVSALRDDGRVAVTGGVADLTDRDDAAPPGAPSSLVAVIARRLDVGPPRAREVLRVAALLGSGFDVGELAAVLDTTPIDLWEVLTEAVEAGMLVDDGERLRFRHNVLREALAAELPLALRVALHQQIGQALVASGAAPERVAERLLNAPTLDSRAIDWLVDRGRTLGLRAPDLAVELIRHALPLVPRTDPRGAALRYHLGWALLYDGRPAEAVATARTAISADRVPARVPALHRLIALAHLQLGDMARARDEAVLGLALPGLAPDDEFPLRTVAASCELFLGDLDAADRTAHLAAEHPEPSVRSSGLSVQSSVLLARRKAERALAVIDRAVAIIGPIGARDFRRISPCLIQALCLAALDRFDAAQEALDEATRRHRQGVEILPLAWRQRVRADVRFLTGRWDEALAEIRAGSQTTDYLGAVRTLRGMRAVIEVHRGDPGPDGEEPGDERAGRTVGWHLRWAAALDREAAGEPVRALTMLRDLWDRRVESLPAHDLHVIWSDIARLALTVGDPEQLRPLRAPAARLPVDTPAPSSHAVHLLVEGAGDADPVRLEAAAVRFADAARPLFAGYAWECAAIVLARTGQPAEARRALDRALECYAPLGADWDSARVTAHLAALGVRRRAGAGPRPRSGWAALTGTERRIAGLVAEGRSNPDIAAELYVSPRTVQHHVSRILTKLGFTSRVELVAAVHHGAAGHPDDDATTGAGTR
jgi:DNA-binding NarL/FixJ family response regulator